MSDALNLHPTNEARMIEAIKAVQAILPGFAIALIVAPFGHEAGQRANYIGNAARDDIRVLLKEMIARWESNYHPASELDQ